MVIVAQVKISRAFGNDKNVQILKLQWVYYGNETAWWDCRGDGWIIFVFIFLVWGWKVT